MSSPAAWKAAIGELHDLRQHSTEGRPSLDEALARAFLGFLAEPGDGTVGQLVAELGAVPLAELLATRPTPTQLLDVAGGAGSALGARTLRPALERWLPRLDPDGFARSIRQAARVGAQLVVPGDAAWPVGVDDLGVHRPLALWVRGEVEALVASPTVALVGARAATGYGEHVTAEAAAGLADRGLAIVSGGAYGIDGVAHRSTLASEGTTIAFLAGGVDRFYPAGHEELLSRIASAGAVVSEVVCGVAPTRWRFLQRNRLIAASSLATVVLEAGHRSGSLNTAGHAAELGRPLGAVPGPVTSPGSAGCHRLLREYDAVCVTSAEEMFELVDVGAWRSSRRAAGALAAPADPARAGAPGGEAGAEPRPDPVRIRVLDALSTRSPRSLDQIARHSGLAVDTVMGALGRLTLTGEVVDRGCGWLRARP